MNDHLEKGISNAFTGAKLEGRRGGGLPCPSSRTGKKCPNLEKKCPDCGHL